MLFVFPAVVRPLVGDAIDGNERAVHDGVGQLRCALHSGVHVVGQSGQKIDAFADVAPGRGGAEGEAGGQAGAGIAVAQVGQYQKRLPGRV